MPHSEYETEYDKMLAEELEKSEEDKKINKEDLNDVISDRFHSEMGKQSEDEVIDIGVAKAIPFGKIISSSDSSEDPELKDRVVYIDLGDGMEDVLFAADKNQGQQEQEAVGKSSIWIRKEKKSKQELPTAPTTTVVIASEDDDMNIF